MDNQLLKIVLILLLVVNFIDLIYSVKQRRQKHRIINLEKVENCDEEEKLPITFTSISIRKPAVNTFELDSDIIISEVIKGPIYLAITAYRCDIGLTNCNNYNEFKIPQICRAMKIKNSLATTMVEKIKPALSCPLPIRTYTLRNGTWDFSIMAGLPTEGYRWLLLARLYDESHKKPRKIFCISTTTYSTFGRGNSGK